MEVEGGECDKATCQARRRISKLEAKKPAADDDKKELDEAKKAYAALRKQIETANDELRVDLMLLDAPKQSAANERELLKPPDFIKEIIKAKGVPLGKGVSIAPDIKFDFKAMKLKDATLKITLRFCYCFDMSRCSYDLLSGRRNAHRT